MPTILEQKQHEIMASQKMRGLLKRRDGGIISELSFVMKVREMCLDNIEEDSMKSFERDNFVQVFRGCMEELSYLATDGKSLVIPLEE